MKKPAPIFLWFLLVAVCFTFATILQPRARQWGRQGDADNVLKTLLGDTRRLFANHFFVKADVSFHSGYYPSIFDKVQAPKNARHMTAAEGSDAEEEHEKQMDFLGPPRDWIERFGRHFMITRHTHLSAGNEREILPWLKISAELDPQRIETYTVSAYWLRKQLGKVTEAEDFLREGLRNNPDSYEILYELGCLYDEEKGDFNRARNLWLQGLKKWSEREKGKKEPDILGFEELVVHLARLEEKQGNYLQAVRYWEMALRVSPAPEDIERHIQELNAKLGGPAPTPQPEKAIKIPGL